MSEPSEHILRCQQLAADGKARVTRVDLQRGSFETPIFMPVGTCATVKALSADDLLQLNADIILSNAYHLALRPGADLIHRQGGLQQFMGWPRLILTDSGGFQLFSLRDLSVISDEGVRFQSHIDGSKQFFSPETIMDVQAQLGSDIAMVLDHCPPGDAARDQLIDAMKRTSAWARRCVECERPPHQARFGIVQGGTDTNLRLQHLEDLSQLPFEGLALGGLSVGEPPAEMYRVLDEIAHRMPSDKPRYLMGVGRPEDLIEAIAAGIDMFDCVMPTRNARNGQLFTRRGKIVISNARHRESQEPIDAQCTCVVCQTYTRAYLRHLYVSKELLYARLASFHNLWFVLRLVEAAREAIRQGAFESFRRAYLNRDISPGEVSSAGQLK